MLQILMEGASERRPRRGGFLEGEEIGAAESGEAAEEGSREAA